EDRCEGNEISEDCFIRANETEVVLLEKERFTRRIKVKKIIPYGEFDQRKPLHDIALVQLEFPIRCHKRVFPICLPTRNFHKIGKNLLVVGWEKHWKDQSKKPIQLLDSWQRQYPSERCHVEDAFNLIAATICTFSKKEKRSSCLGDAGSIAAAKLGNFWFILGIRSFNVNSMCKNKSK
ncbi:unnamed protein product, partial [Larinioides sclopetarius]